MWAQEVVKCKWRSLRRNLTKWTPSLLPHGVFALRPRIQAWPTPKFSSFMSPLEKLDLGTLPVYRWGVEVTVHAKQARTNCVWDKRVQTRKCTAGAFNRPSCSSQNTAAWGRCWSWIASQMVFNRIKKNKKTYPSELCMDSMLDVLNTKTEWPISKGGANAKSRPLSLLCTCGLQTNISPSTVCTAIIEHYVCERYQTTGSFCLEASSFWFQNYILGPVPKLP